MRVREDYYKFLHRLFPTTIFKFKKFVIEKILENADEFINSLKRSWNSIEITKDEVRSECPNFKIEIRQMDKDNGFIILTVPEAKENSEALCAGILFDKQYNVRYFTYEIGIGLDKRQVYYLCEWTYDWKHLNHGCYETNDIDTFIKEVSKVVPSAS